MSGDQSGSASAQLVAAPSTQDFADATPTVSRVTAAPASPEALLFGVVLAGASAVMAVAAFGFAPGAVLQTLFPAAIFLAVWISATWLLTRETGRVLVVLRRGFFLGGLQWAQLSLAWSSSEQVVLGQAGKGVLGRTLQESLGVGLASFLVWFCVAGFVSCWYLTRSPYRELVSDRP